MENQLNHTVLTITGSDSTSGSGVQADIKTISSLEGFAVSAITSITVQNTIGIQDFYDLPADTVAGQIEAIVNDVQPQVAKIGMMRSAAVVCRVAETLRKYQPMQVIYDPVIVSSRGDVLMPHSVVDAVKKCLLPLCSIVTIKKSNAEYILGERITTASAMIGAAQRLLAFGCNAVLLQGGELLDGTSTDVFVEQNVAEPQYLSSIVASHIGSDSHGMSGNLSSAIATILCQEHNMAEAVKRAYNYMDRLAAAHTDLVGRGHDLYNEFAKTVATHYFTNRDVRFYAEQLNVSSRYLAQVTKRIVGESPKTIIDDYLKKEAEFLLASSDMTVQEIAYKLGFTSQANFTKFFRKSLGVAPSEYRRRRDLET